MEIAQFAPQHLRALVLQKAQSWMQPMMRDDDYAETLARSGPCYTGVDGDRIVFCAGVVRIWEGRDMAWALIAEDAGRDFVRVFRAMSRFIGMHETRRIEATVDSNFEAGHRLMRMLGFEREGRMRAYLTDGRDCDLYAIVRG